MISRNLYNNHSVYDTYLSSIHQKSSTNIHKSYSIALPRWTLRFVSGLFLAALGYSTRTHKGKVKGRQVNDPSAILSGPNDSRVLKSRIYRRYHIAMPPVHYQSALQRLWRRVYNLCLNHPEENIIIYKDYLLSVFRRLCCRPDVAAVYSFILGAYLGIPVCMVFGFRDSPSLLCLPSELRSFTYRFIHRLTLS